VISYTGWGWKALSFLSHPHPQDSLRTFYNRLQTVDEDKLFKWWVFKRVAKKFKYAIDKCL
jgi:hypothetical protein